MTTGELDPDAVPWTTAPERVSDICDQLGVPDAVEADATLVAASLWRESNRSPSVLAGAVIYHISSVEGYRVSQEQVAGAAECSAMALRTALSEIREREHEQ